MKKRTTEEAREYMRVYRARKRGMRPDEPGATPPDETSVSTPLDTSSDWKKKLLTAPDDDCAACGHDRQTYHLNAGGVCWAPAPNTRSRRCGCPSYVSAEEPF